MPTYFTETGVKNMKPPERGQKDHFERVDKGLTLMLRLSYGGTKAWRVVAYDGHGKSSVRTLGRYPEMSVAAAKKAAREHDPKKAKAAAEAGTFKKVAEEWLEDHVERRGLRSKPTIKRQLERIYKAGWATKRFFDIDRKTVMELLRYVERKSGAPSADAVLATLRSIMHWYENEDDHYVSPIRKGMNRDTREAHEKARTRILNDDEIRALWTAAEISGPFGAIVKLLLLTAQRREKVATMKWSDIKDGVWTIAAEPREKGNAGLVRLPSVAVEILAAQSEVVGSPFVFPGDERRRHKRADRSPCCFNSWAQQKAKLDARMPAMPHWTLHDLRRTARSLMPRAGVPGDHAERVLGHRITGVEGVYDRYGYADEKAAALDTLAKLIDQIINPPDATNVVQLKLGSAS